jgi:hypothetical protein
VKYVSSLKIICPCGAPRMVCGCTACVASSATGRRK